ncbi:hypothetical protein [Nocardia callitridis]|uniref:MFS transporter n=1 Tax=Nocardia callitridis TaxID=648753 RepID=A0ABP9KG22_9NOCA
MTAAHTDVSRQHARVVVAANVASVVGMVVLAFSGLIPLTGLGIAFLLISAASVAVFATWEAAGLRVVE